MPRELTPQNEFGVEQPITRPVFIALLAFNDPIRICSRGDVNFSGNLYRGVNRMDVSITRDGLSGSLRFFNDGMQYSPTFFNERSAGKLVRVWAAYREDQNFIDDDWDLEFMGVMGRTRVFNSGAFIEVELTQKKHLYTPRYYIRSPVFNHIPPDGTEIKTPDGVIVLNRIDND